MQSNFRIPKGCSCIIHVKTVGMPVWAFGTHFSKTTLKMFILLKRQLLQIENNMGKFFLPFV